jgi:hypothetical protein
MSDEPRPLIHIGYHKTGSTWLQESLFQASLGFKWPGKGPRTPTWRLITTPALDFDPGDARAEFQRELDRAWKRGLVPVVSSERLSGQPFSGGYDSRDLAERLAAVFPEGRVVAVIREQRAMIRSTYSQYVKAGGACKLRQFLNPVTDRTLRMPQFSFEHFKFDRLMDRYRSLFGAENVLVVPFERLTTDPEGFAGDIAAFGGRPLSSGERAEFAARRPANVRWSAGATAVRRPLNKLVARLDINPSPLLDMPGVWRWLNARSSTLDRTVPGWLSRRMERRFQEIIAEEVGDRYAQSNLITSRIVGSDLSAFGYDVAAGGTVAAEKAPIAATSP